eukprot:m.46182 g.46182  ORF g.46182 m.46182 type:complete len:1161 (+) comp11836_c0_seq1:131-3613(+)
MATRAAVAAGRGFHGLRCGMPAGTFVSLGSRRLGRLLRHPCKQSTAAVSSHACSRFAAAAGNHVLPQQALLCRELPPSISKLGLVSCAAHYRVARHGPNSNSRARLAQYSTSARNTAAAVTGDGTNGEKAPSADIENSIKMNRVVETLRFHGHLSAHLDPLQRCWGPWMGTEDEPRAMTADEQPLAHWIHKYPVDSSRGVRTRWLTRQLGLVGQIKPDTLLYVGPCRGGTPRNTHWWKLTELVEMMRDAYCCKMTCEFDHVNTKEREWLSHRMENRKVPDDEVQRTLLEHLIQADLFEKFLGNRFARAKRFGIEGCETLIPGLWTLLEASAQHGVERVELGMAHRGRLNVLANVIGKPLEKMFAELSDQSGFHVGDVVYHLGNIGRLNFGDRSTTVSLAPNPSHLEAVNAVVMGMVRGQQEERGADKVMGVLVHGDASFSGLGMVPETLQLSQLSPYDVGGTVHIVVNNQIGFTTLPRDARVSPHPTTIARSYGIPILHVNADDPSSMYNACKIAADYRATFKRDIIIDLVGYRRHGHNELDDPSITQPLMYNRVADHPSAVQQYQQKLETLGIVTQKELRNWKHVVNKTLLHRYKGVESGDYEDQVQDMLQADWQGDALRSISEDMSVSPLEEPTGLPMLTVQWVGQQLHQIPSDIVVHPRIAGIIRQRERMMLQESSRVDMATAEALAFGTLALHRNFEPPGPKTKSAEQECRLVSLGLNVGHYNIRLSGQDSQRGTFNSRHSVLYDQTTGKRAKVFNFSHMRVEMYNSPLSEFAPLAFEYGYSLARRDTSLTVWEAQFGDFANNAQVVFDQFIASGEERWGLQSGLVVMLPHGYTGQGPDHSSARLERFLALCNDDGDFLPGSAPDQRHKIRAAFERLKRINGLDREQMVSLFRNMEFSSYVTESVDLLWEKMKLEPETEISLEDWERYMTAYIRNHSERDCNLIVANPSTPANLYHILRLQVNREHRKPLILMSPKWLLHHRACTSPLSAFATGTFFDRVIVDGEPSDNLRHTLVDELGEPFLLPPDQIKRVVLCSGQVFYHLHSARKRRKRNDIALVRLEQIAPFPYFPVAELFTQFPNAEFIWCQEEPKNMGAWLYVLPRLRTAVRELVGPKETRKIKYVGRPPAASPATASLVIHQQETSTFLDMAIPPRETK